MINHLLNAATAILQPDAMLSHLFAVYSCMESSGWRSGFMFASSLPDLALSEVKLFGASQISLRRS
jgi:hypothetical protein